MPKGIRSTRFHLSSLPGVLFNAEGDTGGGGTDAGTAGAGGATEGAPATGDEQLGEAGKKALETERAARKAAEAKARDTTGQVATLQAELEKLRQAGETGDQKAQREAEKA